MEEVIMVVDVVMKEVVVVVEEEEVVVEVIVVVSVVVMELVVEVIGGGGCSGHCESEGGRHVLPAWLDMPASPTMGCEKFLMVLPSEPLNHCVVGGCKF